MHITKQTANYDAKAEIDKVGETMWKIALSNKPKHGEFQEFHTDYFEVGEEVVEAILGDRDAVFKDGKNFVTIDRTGVRVLTPEGDIYSAQRGSNIVTNTWVKHYPFTLLELGEMFAEVIEYGNK